MHLWAGETYPTRVPPPLTVLEPTSSPLPIVASIPHSSAFVPGEVRNRFVPQYRTAQPNVDWHLDKLYSFLPALGVTVLKANFSRYLADVNRPLTQTSLRVL